MKDDPLKLEQSLTEEITALFWQTVKKKSTVDIVIVGKTRENGFGLRAHVRNEMLAMLDAELPPADRDWYKQLRQSGFEADTPGPVPCIPIWVMMEKGFVMDRVAIQLSILRVRPKTRGDSV